MTSALSYVEVVFELTNDDVSTDKSKMGWFYTNFI